MWTVTTNPLIAQVDTMGVTAVIATILSVIFAAGAFYNSMHRKRNQEAAEEVEKEETKMRFRPPSRSTLAIASKEADSSSGPSASSEPGPVKVSLASTSSRSSGGSESLFRQVRPYGSQDGLVTDDADEDGYVWE